VRLFSTQEGKLPILNYPTGSFTGPWSARTINRLDLSAGLTIGGTDT